MGTAIKLCILFSWLGQVTWPHSHETCEVPSISSTPLPPAPPPSPNHPPLPPTSPHLYNHLRHAGTWPTRETVMHFWCCRCWEGETIPLDRSEVYATNWMAEGASWISDHSLVFLKGFWRGTTVVWSGIGENQRVFEDFEEIHQESCAPLKLSEADLISLNTSEVTEVP